MPELSIAIAARRRMAEAAPEPVPELLDPVFGNAIGWTLSRGGTVLAPLDPSALVAALGRVLRGDRYAVAVLLDRPVQTLQLTAQRALDRADRSAFHIAVDAVPTDPRTPSLVTALRLTAAVSRARTAATWRALEALDANGDNAERAAAALGCSGQAVRRHRQRGHAAATAELDSLLATLLAPPLARDLEPSPVPRAESPADAPTARPFWAV